MREMGSNEKNAFFVKGPKGLIIKPTQRDGENGNVLSLFGETGGRRALRKGEGG